MKRGWYSCRWCLSTIGLLAWWCVCPLQLIAAPPTLEQVRKVAHVRQLLRTASELAIRQHISDREAWGYALWGYALRRIGEAQLRAKDWDGARRSLEHSNHSESGLFDLAKCLAKNGERARSLELYRELSAQMSPADHRAEDQLTLGWIEYLIGSGDLEQAAKITENIRGGRYLSEGYRKMAIAFHNSGKIAVAQDWLLRYARTARELGNLDRFVVLCKAADAQILCGDMEAARLAIDSLKEASFDDVQLQAGAWWNAASFCARLNDLDSAVKYFHNAIDVVRAIDLRTDLSAVRSASLLEQIALAEARCGFVDEALTTLSKISGGIDGIASGRSRVVVAIVEMQLKGEESKSAEATCEISVGEAGEVCEEALMLLVGYYVRGGSFVEALNASRKIHDPSKRTVCVLQIATGYALANQQDKARAIAGEVELSNEYYLGEQGLRFDFMLPNSWGRLYGCSRFSRGAFRRAAILGASAVGSAAIHLASAINLDTGDLADQFNNVEPEVIHSLALAYASCGHKAEIVDWYCRIGSDESGEHPDVVLRRVYGLLGAAEGNLNQ